jgi:hypothetical protein
MHLQPRAFLVPAALRPPINISAYLDGIVEAAFAKALIIRTTHTGISKWLPRRGQSQHDKETAGMLLCCSATARTQKAHLI